MAGFPSTDACPISPIPDPLGGSSAHRAHRVPRYHGELAGSGLPGGRGVRRPPDPPSPAMIGSPPARLPRPQRGVVPPLPVFSDWGLRPLSPARSTTSLSTVARLVVLCSSRLLWQACRRRDEENRQSPASGWRLPLSSSPPTPEQQQEDGVAVKCASVSSSVGASTARDAGGSPLSITCLHLPSVDDDSVDDDTTTSRGGAPPPAPV